MSSETSSVIASLIVEGELVRDWYQYEADDLAIDGRQLQELLEALPVVDVKQEHSQSRHVIRETTNYGRVRLTIEVLR